MSSTLNGLMRTLTWSDFPPRQGSAPGPGQHATAAFTFSSFSTSGESVQPVSQSRPAQFQVADTLTVTVSFGRSQSFVMSWVPTRPQQFQTDLLNHEQGHYNITALVSRDFFVDVMLLKSQRFSTAQAGVNAINQIRQQTLVKISLIQSLYDREVHPEQDAGRSRGPIQQQWDRMIQTAFTQARTPASAAPNGVAHKVRLVDVLIQNGRRV